MATATAARHAYLLKHEVKFKSLRLRKSPCEPEEEEDDCTAPSVHQIKVLDVIRRLRHALQLGSSVS